MGIGYLNWEERDLFNVSGYGIWFMVMFFLVGDG